MKRDIKKRKQGEGNPSRPADRGEGPEGFDKGAGGDRLEANEARKTLSLSATKRGARGKFRSVVVSHEHKSELHIGGVC